jgi:site-specific recombinase XerD
MKLYFELKKISPKQGTIRAIISDHGVKGILSTGVKLELKEWKEGKPKQTAKNANINLTLGKYTAAFEKYISITQAADEITTLSKAQFFVKANVKTANSTRGQKSIADLLVLFKTAQAGKLTEGALKPYTTLVNHLIDFNPRIQLSDIDNVLCDKFTLFLSQKSKHVKGAQNLQNPTINKMIVSLKAFCKWAYANRHTSNTAWENVKKVKDIDQRIIALTSNEFNLYASFDFGQNEKLARVRDVFAFAVYTGLRFEDLSQVAENIKISGNDYYIHINTTKTRDELQMKLVQQAKDILVKYNHQLPLISNQKTNKYIKEGAKLCGITRQEAVIRQHLTKVTSEKKAVCDLLSIHDARKTFITLALENGITVSEVMRMSTHKDFRSLSRYISLERERINDKLQSVFALKKVS